MSNRSEYWANIEMARAAHEDAKMKAWREVNRRAAEMRKAREAAAEKKSKWWRF